MLGPHPYSGPDSSARSVAIALAASGGGTGDEAGYTKSVRVAPSVQNIPTHAERNQGRA